MKYTEKELTAIRELRRELQATKRAVDNRMRLLQQTSEHSSLSGISVGIGLFLLDTEHLFEDAKQASPKQQSQHPA
jgi:hypothetical protein